MIGQTIYYDKYKWTIHIYYMVDRNNTDEIIQILQRLGSNEDYIRDAEHNIRTSKMDTGFTYSNCVKKESVVVINEASGSEEFMNTLVHEARHLQQHISDTYGIEDDSEEACCIIGCLIQWMYKKCKYIVQLYK